MRRELAAFFTNPAAYIVTAIFLVATGIFFFSTFFINGRADLRNFFGLLPIMLSLFVPALTMRLFSEELRSGSIETLMTLPVTSAQVVLGKFLAAFLTSAAMLVPTFFYVVTACVFGKVDFGPIIGGYFGALFLCALYSAIGVFSSALTKNQIIAFFTALALSFALTLFGTLLIFLPAPLVRFFSWLSVTTHFQQISRGIADTRDVIYFASLVSVFLLLTQQKFAVKKNRDEKIDCSIFFVILILANLVGAHAFLRADLTSGKMYSISSASKELVKNLQEPMSVNVFFSSDLPAPYNSVDQYLRDILVEYKSAANKNFSYKIFDMNKSENEDVARSYGISQIQVQKVETTEVSAKAVWMGIAITYGDDIKIFNSIDSMAGLEYRLTTAMSKMISTSDALAQLDKGLTVKLFPASELADAGISNLERLEQIVSEAINSLNQKFSGKIDLQVENSSSDEAKQISERYGIQLVTFQDEDGGEKNAVLGIVVELGENFVSIPLRLQNFFGWHLLGLDNIQANISDAIEGMLSKTVQIGYITGYGENELYANPYGNPGASNSENFRNVLNDIYSLRQINLAEEEIPLNIKCIVINGSREEFSQSELFKIDQFVMKGGNILFCLDPLVESEENGPNAPPAYLAPQNGLQKILNAYGIAPGANYVFDQNCYQENSRNGESAKLEWAPLVMQNALDSKNPITKFLSAMIFLQNGSIDLSGAEKNPDLKTTVLAHSSEKSWLASENIILYPGYIFPPSDDSQFAEQNLAVLVEGKFPSAFANEEIPLSEKISEEDDEISEKENAQIKMQETETSASLTTQEKISKGIQSAKIIFVSSALVTTGSLIDKAGNEPMAYFMRNAIDYLNGSQEFCEMRTKGIARNLLEIKNPASATAFKLFNQFGLAALVALIGLFVWKARSIRRSQIRLRYNADDEREVNVQ